MNREDERHEIVNRNLVDGRVEGYYVFNSQPWGGCWLHTDNTWGPFKTARMYFFYERAEEARKVVTGRDDITFVFAKLKQETR